MTTRSTMGTRCIVIDTRHVMLGGRVLREYLCLTRRSLRRYRLFTGRFERLVPAHELYDAETEDFRLADDTGPPLLRIEGEYAVGGEITWVDDDATVQFDTLDDPKVDRWLLKNRWYRHGIWIALSHGIRSADDPETPSH